MIIYFVTFMAMVYFIIVVPYKHIQARRGQTVFGDPAPVKTCPACLSTDLPADAQHQTLVRQLSAEPSNAQQLTQRLRLRLRAITRPRPAAQA